MLYTLPRNSRRRCLAGVYEASGPGTRRIPTNYWGEVLDPTDKDQNRVLPGLMAVGEAGCVSVHGGNRLGSNSLIDLVVFGRASAIKAAEVVDPNEKKN